MDANEEARYLRKLLGEESKKLNQALSVIIEIIDYTEYGVLPPQVVGRVKEIFQDNGLQPAWVLQ